MSKTHFHELAKIVNVSPNQQEYLQHFYRTLKNYKGLEPSAEYLEKELERIKKRQSELGKELTLLNIERIAIMAVKDEQ